jgi:hypothetical protein
MAITATPYGTFLKDLLGGVHNVVTDTDRVVLLTSSYTPNQDNHATYADVIASEVTGAGYTAGGPVLTGKSVTYDTTANTATLAASSVTWTALTVSTRYAVIYRYTGTNSTSRLIGFIDFGAVRTYTAEPFELSFPSGAVVITAI